MVKRHANRQAWVLCGLLFGTALLGRAAPAEKLYPVDEGPKDPSFLAFRHQLIVAAKNRDYRFLVDHLDPHIVVNPFGEPITGIKEFEEEWRPKNPKSTLWPELLTILSLGGTFERREASANGKTRPGLEFVAPYVASRWTVAFGPGGFPDPSESWAIIGKNVPMRRRPRSTSRVVAHLSYDVVEVSRWKPYTPDERWVKITTSTGKHGYVASDQIRSAADTEAHFARQHGKWVMTELFATAGE